MTFDSSEVLSVLTRTASGKFLLDSCFSAFCAELASLESHLTAMVDICASHFKEPHSILHPPYDTYITNPAFSMPALLLKQTLLYLSYVEDNVAVPDALSPSFTDFLQTNADYGVGVVGFSSGIMSACVVATSPSPYVFVCHAVEAYRLALRIGIQSQICRAQILQPGRHDSRPWGLVLIGINKNLLQQMVHEFNEVFPPEYDYMYNFIMNHFKARWQRSCHYYRGDERQAHDCFWTPRGSCIIRPSSACGCLCSRNKTQRPLSLSFAASCGARQRPT